MDTTIDSIFETDPEFVEAFLNNLPQVEAEGKAALIRLLASAYQEHAEASRVAAYLLSLYDSQRFACKLQDLLSFDIDTLADCLLVLTMTLVSDVPLHETIDGGQVAFEKLALQRNLGAPGGHA